MGQVSHDLLEGEHFGVGYALVCLHQSEVVAQFVGSVGVDATVGLVAEIIAAEGHAHYKNRMVQQAEYEVLFDVIGIQNLG